MPPHDGAPMLLESWRSWNGAIDCSRSSRTWTASELRAESDRFAAALSRDGVREGDAVGVMVCNSAAFPVTLFALLGLGCNPILLFAGSRSAEVSRAANELGMSFVVHDFDEEVSQLERDAFPVSFTERAGGPELSVLQLARDRNSSIVDGHGLIIHSTSGTYGSAHFCIRNQCAAVAEGRNYVGSIAEYAHARVRMTTPLSHGYAYGFGLVSSLLTDSTLVLEPAFNPRRILRREHENQSDIMAIVPPMARALAHAKASGESAVAKAVFYAGAPCPATAMREFSTTFGTELFAIYGTTETGGATASETRSNTNHGVGKPLRNVEVSVHASDRYASIGAGVGELHVRTTSMMQGYVSETIAPPAHPWPTGDIGHIDADGNIIIVGRIKDFINVGGMKVDPRDVESVLLQQPGVVDAAVYPGLRDDESEYVQAAIQVRDGALDTVRLRKVCLDQLDAHKVPMRFHVVDSIPRSPSGKCLKVQCPDFPRALLLR